jgi:hypothetical protein
MPERLKELVLKADKNGDSQVSLEELLQAMKDRKPDGKQEKGPDAKPEKRPEGKPEKRPERGPEGRPGPRAEDQSRNGPPHGFGGPGMGPGMGMPPFGGGWGGRPEMDRQGGPHGRPGPDKAAFGPPGPGKGEGRPAKSLAKHSVEGIRDNLPQMPNLKVIFERLDADKDGKLNFEEFKSGAIKMHRLFAAQEKAQKSPKTRQAGMQPNGHKQPWQGMHRGGWGFGGPQGPQFHGNGPWGHQAQANGPWGHHSQGYGQHFRGYGPWGQSFHGFGPGPQQFGPHFQHGFAMNHFPGPGPQFNNERRDYDGPGPKNREQQGPRSHDREPSEGRNHDRGPHSDRSWWD